MQKKVTITVAESLNDRWGKVAKKHNLSKSGMIEEYLETILPILEQESANRMMAKALKRMSKEIDLTGELFDNMEYDKSVEDYKEKKRG